MELHLIPTTGDGRSPTGAHRRFQRGERGNTSAMLVLYTALSRSPAGAWIETT